MPGMVTRRRRRVVRGNSAAAGAFGFQRADEIGWGDEVAGRSCGA
jgi:hypothetical protein